MTADLSYDWIQARLLELSAGTLAPEDRARLELIAQADPFVADAMEGYTRVADADHAGHLEQLRQRIASPKRARRRWLMPNLTVTAIAAIFMILIGTWAVVRWSGRPTEESREVILSPAPPAVTGMDQSARTLAESVPEGPSLAYPGVTRNAMEAWLNAQSRFPLESDTTRDAFLVIVHFQVKEDGRPFDVSTAGEALPDSMQEEAKRLVSEGPDWHCPEGLWPCTGRLEVRFRK